jgi:hypothetical protein
VDGRPVRPQLPCGRAADGDRDRHAHEQRPQPAQTAPAGRRRLGRGRLVPPGEAAVPLVEVEISVEAEELGVRPEEALRVDLAGK